MVSKAPPNERGGNGYVQPKVAPTDSLLYLKWRAYFLVAGYDLRLAGAII